MRKVDYHTATRIINALPMVRELTAKAGFEIIASGKSLEGSKIEVTTAPDYRAQGTGEFNALQIEFQAHQDGWHIISVSGYHRPWTEKASYRILNAGTTKQDSSRGWKARQPKENGFASLIAKTIREADPTAKVRNMTLPLECRDLNDLFEQRRKRVLASMLERGQVRQGPAIAKSWNTRQPKEDFAPESGGRTSSIVDAIIAGRGMTPPSPEARRLDAIRAVYDAADEGNKVQSALTHAREIASDLGEIEPAKRLSALFGLIKSAQAECAEIARELAVSGK